MILEVYFAFLKLMPLNVKQNNSQAELREIDFFNFINSIQAAIQIETGYYESIVNFNRVCVEINYFTN